MVKVNDLVNWAELRWSVCKGLSARLSLLRTTGVMKAIHDRDNSPGMASSVVIYSWVR
jgi:hypothetical protein